MHDDGSMNGMRGLGRGQCIPRDTGLAAGAAVATLQGEHLATRLRLAEMRTRFSHDIAFSGTETPPNDGDAVALVL